MSTAHAAACRHYGDAKLIWDYHQLGHQLRPCSVGIGLGSHDLGVATLAADLYRAGLFPVLVFSGGNSPTTAARFPRGEAVQYAEHAITSAYPPAPSSSSRAPPTPGRTSTTPATRSSRLGYPSPR